MQLLREQGPVVLDKLTIPKFSKIFVSLIKLDNAEAAHGKQTWPSAIPDLLSLVQASGDPEHQKMYIRFIVKSMQIFDEDVVERSQDKSNAEMTLNTVIKDFLRDQNQVEPIVTLLS